MAPQLAAERAVPSGVRWVGLWAAPMVATTVKSLAGESADRMAEGWAAD
jgi:hypothetical protein